MKYTTSKSISFNKPRMRKALLGVCLALASWSAYSQKNPVAYGVNLAGADFGSTMPGEFDKTYTYPRPSELDYFKAKGLTLIRLPFKWERIQPQLNGPLDARELSRIKQVIKQAQQRKLWVILDLHNYGRRQMDGTEYLIGSERVSIQHIGDLWQKLAQACRSYSNIWGYGLMNEPHDLRADTPWFSIAQHCITQIRKTDPKTAILVGGDQWSSGERWLRASDTLKYLKDPSRHLIFEAHVYFDKDGSGTYKHDYLTEEASAQKGIERVEPFVNWLKANHFQGLVGEYGVPDTDPRWLETLDQFLAYLRENQVSGTYWAAGPWWGDYTLAVSPRQGADRPQMKILEKYPTL